MRNASLDGVRAVLALWVVLGHLCKQVGVHVPVLSNPAVAVDLFMVLSGYFIAATHAQLTQEQGWQAGSRSFVIRRVMRIWPLYALLLTLCWLMLEPISEARLLLMQTFPPADRDPTALLPFAEPDALSALLHYTLLSGLSPSQATSTPLPDWSLSLELQFYLLFPLLALVLRARPLWLCLLAAGLAFASPGLLGDYLTPGRWAHFRQPAALVYKLNFFLLGVMAWRLFARRQRGHGPDGHDGHDGVREDLLPWLAVLLCLVPTGAQAALGAFGLLYLMAHPEGGAAQWLGAPLLAWLGRISFAIYLLHLPLMRVVVAALVESGIGFATLPGAVRYGLALLCLLPPLLLASHVLHRFVEEPGNRLARRWTSRRRSDGVNLTPARPHAAVRAETAGE